jgi:hypothetical protein
VLPNLDTQATLFRLERSFSLAHAERTAPLIAAAAGSPAPRHTGAPERATRKTSVRPTGIGRRLVTVALVLGAVLAWSGVALAQDATPAGTAPAELHITITETGYDLSATTVPAGQIRLTVENQASATGPTGDNADADLVLPPAGTTVDAVLADIAAINAMFLGTPVADTGSPKTNSGLPTWIYQATWAGGPVVPAGGTVEATVTLTAGTWILLNGSFGTPQQPTTLEVTGPAAATDAPPADATVTLAEYAFGGLTAGLPAGQQTWKITNTGAQPHFMGIFRAPAGITAAELMAIFENGGLPPDSPYAESDFDFKQPGLGVLSTGQTTYLTLDLAPGTYVAICHVPDVETGTEHAMLGMIQVFEVGGTATGTPAA